jgi:SAM-dependent methyltransferase
MARSSPAVSSTGRAKAASNLPPHETNLFMNPPSTESDPERLRSIYRARFEKKHAYRRQVWSILCRDYFQKWVPASGAVLDLGCGCGEFINQILAARKYGMDLNPDTAGFLNPDVTHLQQSCSEPWRLEPDSLDVVFTSNFFEHLPDKAALGRTLDQARRALKPGGRLICLGPNIRFLAANYWDFWDHYLPLSDYSLAEGLETHGFQIELALPKFMPYTMARGSQPPLFFIRAYLALPPAWSLLGKQFLLIARK